MLAWRDYEHPDWENLAAATYRAFVSGPISNDAKRMPNEFGLAAFDIDAEDFEFSSWIAPSHTEKNLAFVRLRSVGSPFDQAEFAQVDPDTLRVTQRNLLRPLDGAFVFVRRAPDGYCEPQDSIEASD